MTEETNAEDRVFFVAYGVTEEDIEDELSDKEIGEQINLPLHKNLDTTLQESFVDGVAMVTGDKADAIRNTHIDMVEQENDEDEHDRTEKLLMDLMIMERDRQLGYSVSEQHRDPRELLVEAWRELSKTGHDPNELIFAEDQEILGIEDEKYTGDNE